RATQHTYITLSLASSFFFFFFILIRRPPRSTLFPYTTLFRSLTLTGSLMAAGKLQELLPQRPITYKGQNLVNLSLLGIAVVIAVDRKSTRLNSSHVAISYAVFCLKKKNQTHSNIVLDGYSRGA